MFDPTKPVRTRDGRPARIICTDRKALGAAPIAALVMGVSGEDLSWHNEDGIKYGYHHSAVHDLVNYDPFEITDEEAELVIDLLNSIRHLNVAFPANWEDNIRNRNFIEGRMASKFRDVIIKHRKTK